jgi:hypothetical protein
VSERAIIAAEGSTLEPGGSVRTVCPFCQGGRSSEKTLVITLSDDGALLFVCHRANCGARGSLGGGCIVRKPEKRLPTPRPLDTDELYPIYGREIELIEGDWHMKPPRWWKHHVGMHMIAMPVFDPQFRTRGHILRQYPGYKGPKPKSLTFKEKVDEPWLHWASVGRHIFVVEDIPSAERLALLGYGAVAILGSYIGDDAMLEIVSVANRRKDDTLYISLDRDATKKAMEYADKIRLLHHRVCVLTPYPKDFKNLSPEELNECLSGM